MRPGLTGLGLIGLGLIGLGLTDPGLSTVLGLLTEAVSGSATTPWIPASRSR
jgi:hypothetical protein